MEGKRNIFIILILVMIIAVGIQMTRAEFLIRLNEGEVNTEIMLSEEVESTISDEQWNSIVERKILVVTDESQKVCTDIRDNIVKTLDYMAYPYDNISTEKLTGLDTSYNMIIIVASKLDTFKPFDELMDYVFNGGKVYIPFRVESGGNSYRLRKLGIIDEGDYADVNGLHFFKNVLIKGDGIEVGHNGEFENGIIEYSLDKDCDVIMRSFDGSPLLWERQYGKGSFMYYNGTILGVKELRGVISGTIALLDKTCIYPIVNAKVSFIDDFPAPLPLGYNEEIQRDFNRDTPSFFKEIWWPDMLEVSHKYNVIYTGVAIGTYENKVEDNEEISEQHIEVSMDNLIYFGRDLLQNKGELGIHGFNHQPLRLEPYPNNDLGYNTWASKEAMAHAISNLNNYLESVYHQYKFQVYVPPSNILSDAGRQALIDSSMDIKMIASLYLSSAGLTEYTQEYEVGDDGIIEFPRFGAGYLNDEMLRFDTYTGITLHGIFSHFVHPDDVLDSERSEGNGWEYLFQHYSSFNKDIYDKFEWIRPLTASDAGIELLEYLDTEYKMHYGERSVTVYMKHYHKSISFILRSDREIEQTIACTAKEIDKNVYLVESESDSFEIVFK